MEKKKTLWYNHTVEYYAEFIFFPPDTPPNMDEFHKHRIQQMKQE